MPLITPAAASPTRRTARPSRAIRKITAAVAGGGSTSGASGNSGVSAVIAAFSAFLTSLGIPHNVADLKFTLLRGRGGSGGGDGGDVASRLVDYFMSPASDALLPCVSCAKACRKDIKRFIIDAAVAARAAEALVRAIDTALKRYKNTTLLRYLYTRLTELVNNKLKSRKVFLLGSIGIKPVLAAGPLLQYDVTRGVRVRVLEWVFETYVDYYLPATVRYNLRHINSEMFKRFRPQVVAFLRGNDGDLAPVAGMLVRHLVEMNPQAVTTKTAGCILCSQAPFACHSQRASRVPERA